MQQKPDQLLQLLIMGAKRILLIDDERDIRRLFKKFLSNHGFIVDTAKDGSNGLDYIAKKRYDLILLDLMLPDTFGGDLCSTIRVKTTTPILILTASDSELHYIKSLDAGADDFIQKSNSMDVILAKIKANLRREVSKGGDLLVKGVDYVKATISDWSFIPEKKILVTPDEMEVYLTDHENKLMILFVSQHDSIVSRDTIAERLGLHSKTNMIRAVDTLVCRFRNKLKTHENYTDFIETIRGKGYKLTGTVDYEKI